MGSVHTLGTTLILFAALSICPAGRGAIVAYALTSDGTLYDLDLETAEASNPRGGELVSCVGMEVRRDGTLLALTTWAGVKADSLFSIDPQTGGASLIGSTGVHRIAEGDLTEDPETGMLYGCVTEGDFGFFDIDPYSGQGNLLGTMDGADDPSGLSFDLNMHLYALDVDLDAVLKLDPSDGSIISVTPLSMPLYTHVAAMDVDPVTGTMYVAGYRDDWLLFTLNPATGELTTIGKIGAAGIAGLAIIPEPSALALLALTAVVSVQRRR